MEKIIFLKKLERARKLKLINPSEEIKSSYIKKAEDCIKSSKILFQNKLYENSTAEAYYGIYNSILSLLFLIGIKSENHSASIILLDKLLENKELSNIASWAKEERIDKQYYVDNKQTLELSKKSCNNIILESEKFLLKIKIIINEMNNEKINEIRKNLKTLLNIHKN